jgi:hypothetical protein
MRYAELVKSGLAEFAGEVRAPEHERDGKLRDGDVVTLRCPDCGVRLDGGEPVEHVRQHRAIHHPEHPALQEPEPVDEDDQAEPNEPAP